MNTSEPNSSVFVSIFNNLTCPIIVSSCKIGVNSSCKFTDDIIRPGTAKLVESCVEEWHLHARFDDEKILNEWKKIIGNDTTFGIAQISTIKYINKENYLIYNDLFTISYDDEFKVFTISFV